MLNSFKKNSLGYKLIIPGLIIILIVNIVPLIQGLYYSFFDYSLKSNDLSFIGLKNYIDIFSNDAKFYSVLGFTFIYSITTVAISYTIALVMALVLNQNIKFRGIFRALILLPWVIPIVVATISWRWILDYHYGIINTVLLNLNIIKEPILFLTDKLWAKFIVIIITSWKSFPFMTVVILAGLQSIPKELYEAAHIDGAGGFKSFRFITIPFIKNISLIITILLFIWTFNSFEYIWLLTKGGPARSTFVLPILTYYTAFYRQEIGYASAIATTMLVALLIISFAYLNIQKDKIITK